MQIKNQISFLRYGIFSIIHLAVTLKYFGNEKYGVLLIVFLSILINQLCLFVAMHELMNKSAEERDNTKVFVLFGAKFIILAAGLWYGMQNYGGNTLIIIGNYIFQLIILTLRIKRLGKNN
jgi:hypothetical protein